MSKVLQNAVKVLIALVYKRDRCALVCLYPVPWASTRGTEYGNDRIEPVNALSEGWSMIEVIAVHALNISSMIEAFHISSSFLEFLCIESEFAG